MNIADYLIHSRTLQSLMSAVRGAERFLGPEDGWVEDDRRILFEAAQCRLGHLHRFTVEKGPADYITTVPEDENTVEKILLNGPYQRNLLSTRKYRTHHGGGKQWACGSFVYDPVDEPWQHHVYIFESPNGIDIYGHREDSVRYPAHHLNVAENDDLGQIHGDPNNRIGDLLNQAVVPQYERQF